MDARRFDRLTRALSEAGTRRGLLGLLASLPVVGVLLDRVDHADETEAKGRRKRRKKPHHHRKKTGNRSGNTKKRRCDPESKAKTCSGKCGSVQNNCRETVDCGSCDCPSPCGECFTCQEQGPNTHARCVVDPEQQSDACGSDGQVCQSDGACECDAGSCRNPTPICDDGVCVRCSGTHPCPTGCCDAAGACHAGNSDTACGGSGACDICTGQHQCQNRSCVCVPDCIDKVCGSDGCVGICQPNSCPDGQVCVDGKCKCNATSCPTGCCDANGACQLGRSDTVCGRAGQECAACTGGRVCLADIGVCALIGCTGPSDCPCGFCLPHLGGGHAGGICANPGLGCVTDCALCAAAGQTCFIPNSGGCPPNRACVAPC